MDEVLAPIRELATTGLTTLLVAIAGMVLGFFKLKLDEAKEKRLRQAAEMAVGFAEEKGRQYLQQTGDKLPGYDSARIAVERVMATVPRVSQEEARKIVESVLPYARGAMVAGASELGKALTAPTEPTATPILSRVE